jgi:hypothetical protein
MISAEQHAASRSPAPERRRFRCSGTLGNRSRCAMNSIESQDPIQDRTREHLATRDRAIDLF